MDLTPKMGEDKRKGTSVSPTLSPVASSLTNFPPTQNFEVTQTVFVQIQLHHYPNITKYKVQALFSRCLWSLVLR